MSVQIRGSKSFDALIDIIVFLKEFFEKINFKKGRLHLSMKITQHAKSKKKYTKFGNFCKNFIFVNSAERHI